MIFGRRIRLFILASILLPMIAPFALAQPAVPTTRSVRSSRTLAYASLRGKPVEDVRVMGNTQVSTAVILNVVRTRKGDPFDPDTVDEDYQRIYAMKKFANVQAQAEPTTTGVIVTFVVTEQKQIREIRYVGNSRIDTPQLQQTIDVHEGEAIDNFRISIAKQAIEALYRDKNYPYAHVEIDKDQLAQAGNLIFNITEGPNVKVRRIEFIGNNSFSDDRLRDQVQTKYWIWIFRPGTYDPETVDTDVGALRHYYESKGFFDVRVGRKVVESPDQTEIKVQFIIDEGVRYRVDKLVFRGNKNLTEQQLRKELKLTEGQFFDQELLQRDIRQVVRDYSPFGFIYQRGSNDPDYLRIGNPKYPYEIATVFHRESGKVDLVYEISEGKPFKIGRILVKGNGKTQEKVVLREMRVEPGQKYNSGELSDASERLRTSPYFSGVSITPIGDDPAIRDVLVEVVEAKTASFGVGAGINSNGGLGANITYEQRNFDITNFPDSWTDIFSDRAFIGAGQNLRITLEPGTEASNASIRFTEPWIFDQPYSFTGEAYWRDRIREHWDETRAGGRITFGKRWNYIWSTGLTLRGEDVQIHNIEDEDLTTVVDGQTVPVRAPEILALKGHSTVTSAGINIRRDTTNRGIFPYRGSSTFAAWDSYGALGGEFTFQKFTVGWDMYKALYDDLLDRKTVLSLHANGGWIWGSAPFFERFYAGGLGTIRGFRFRGVSPRSGPDDDVVGGEFSLTGTAEVSFPLYGENLRGVVFTDVGTVEPEFEIHTIRSSVGFGFRLVLPIFGQAPVALDFALPLTKSSEDDTEWISFSFGFQQ